MNNANDTKSKALEHSIGYLCSSKYTCVEGLVPSAAIVQRWDLDRDWTARALTSSRGSSRDEFIAEQAVRRWGQVGGTRSLGTWL